MRLPRMTTRRWMIAVSVVAVLIGVITRIFAPILRDLQEREDDARWVRERAIGPYVQDGWH
jgi:hypothetical protein